MTFQKVIPHEENDILPWISYNMSVNYLQELATKFRIAIIMLIPVQYKYCHLGHELFLLS